jgi:hypothetical protein
VFSEIWKGKTDRFTLTVVRRADVKPDRILRHFEGNSLGNRESLFFYYCGHGGWDAHANGIDGNEKGHFLATSGGTLYRSQLRQQMLRRSPYGAFILTDCCSNIAGVEPPRRNVPAVWEGFQNLFFDSRDLADIQAATRGEFG